MLMREYFCSVTVPPALLPAGECEAFIMYRLSRWMLQLSVVCGVYSLSLVALLSWPWTGVFVLGIGFAVAARRNIRHLTTLGSARWADERDLTNAGLIDSKTGLILGRIPVRSNPLGALCSLFWRRITPKHACEQVLKLLKRDRERLVRASNAIHTAVFAPSGLGKGVSLIIPFLRECDESCVVVDFKGENALLTAEHRRKVHGHQIVLLDPFRVITQTSDCFNPLNDIKDDDPLAIDECNDLAKALVLRAPDEKEPHWNDSAEAWISAMLATVVRYGESDSRSLQTVRDLLSNPERTELAIKLMRESDAWEGMLARKGGQLAHFVDREKSSTLSTVSRHLRFLDTPAIAASTRDSSFDPAKLLTGKMTVYLILPPEHMRAQSSLLRMWIGSLLKAVVRGGLRTKNNVHFVLDEAASLGHLEVIEDAVDKFRGYGVRLQFYYQSLGQLKKCFPDGQDQTLSSNTTQTFFGVSDVGTAEMISSRLGEHTIIVESGGTSDGSSWQRSMGAQLQESSGHSYNTSRNWQQQARKLLKPEEVLALPPRVAITFMPGLPPICTTLLRYYEEPKLGFPAGRLTIVFHAVRALIASILILGVNVAVAAVLTKAVCRAAGGLNVHSRL